MLLCKLTRTRISLNCHPSSRCAEQLSGLGLDCRKTWRHETTPSPERSSARTWCVHTTLTANDDGSTGYACMRKKVLHHLGCRQDHGLRTPVPAVAGTESLLEEGLLVVDAGFLVQGPEVPEDPHVNKAKHRTVLEVFPDDMGYNRQVKPRRVRMTSGQQ